MTDALISATCLATVLHGGSISLIYRASLLGNINQGISDIVLCGGIGTDWWV
jgi:hypothetical protein